MSPNYTVSLSTCWNSQRHTDGYAMLREAADLGFSHVELSHGTRISLVSGILKAMNEGWIGCRSLHNFCPLPMGVMGAAPNLFEPSGWAYERTQWFKQTLKTLEFAERVKAHRVVLHLGRVHYWLWDPIKLFEQRIEKSGMHPGEHTYDSDFAHLLAKLSLKAKVAMQRVICSLERIIPYARRAGVVLGLENRERISELPLDSGFKSLLDHFRGCDNVGFWYDCGHAQLKQEEGVIDAVELLKAHADRLVGMHIHDVVNHEDHRAPGSPGGAVRLKEILPILRPEHVAVLELNPYVKPNEVVAGREFVQKMLDSLH